MRRRKIGQNFVDKKLIFPPNQISNRLPPPILLPKQLGCEIFAVAYLPQISPEIRSRPNQVASVGKSSVGEKILGLITDHDIEGRLE